MLALKRGTPIDLQELPSTTEPSSSRRSADFINVPASEVFERGKSFFDTVYGSNSDKLMKIMDLSGTPDLGASGRLMYAYFLSNTNILNGKETMFVTMTGMLVIDVSTIPYISSTNCPRFNIILGSEYAFESYERCYKSWCHVS